MFWISNGMNWVKVMLGALPGCHVPRVGCISLDMRWYDLSQNHDWCLIELPCTLCRLFFFGYVMVWLESKLCLMPYQVVVFPMLVVLLWIYDDMTWLKTVLDALPGYHMPCIGYIALDMWWYNLIQNHAWCLIGLTCALHRLYFFGYVMVWLDLKPCLMPYWVVVCPV